MIHIDLDRHDPGIGHQPMRRFHAVGAAERRGHADGAALVAADRHVHFAQRHQHGAAGRRAAGGIAHLVGVVHRPGGVGVAAAGQAERLAMGLADDRPAGIQNALDDGCVDLRHVAFQRRGAVHHRHAGQHDVVLQHDRPALEPALRGALHGGFHIPGVVRVLSPGRPVSRHAGIAHRGKIVRHRIDHIVGGDVRPHQFNERGDIGIAQRQPDFFGDVEQLGRGGNLDCHSCFFRGC